MRPDLADLGDLAIYPRSPVEHAGTVFFLARANGAGIRTLGVRGDATGFEGTRHEASGALLCPLSPASAAALRARLPWLRPATIGLATSAGFGDRLGLATPGHVRAMRQLPEGAIAPVFAQQSVRENLRTGRAPQQVLDDATWGVLEEGWREPWGADADHLKTVDDVAAFARAGYTLFTIDPGDHVDDTVAGVTGAELEARIRALPWEALEDTVGDLERRHLARRPDLGGLGVAMDRPRLWCAAAKYGRAVAHTVALYRHISVTMADRPFELEVSVDETSSPTTVSEHVYVAAELRRLGVSWVSLAPRFVGRFEKGVDYIGDLEDFTAELARHAAVAQALGPYKLSLHSGSDKFSIYPTVARLVARAASGGPLVHVKTAGTSYLEALRTVARADQDLFREVVCLARERYETDRASYHVSARLDRTPDPGAMSDADLPDSLEVFDLRQVLHVTYGSVLERLGERLRDTLRRSEEMYAADLEAHFKRHLTPFARRQHWGGR